MTKPTTFRLPERNTRFVRPIVCPTTGEHVSAETLYNRACDALGYVLREHIGDLVFDNLSYGTPMGEVDTEEMCDAVYAWAADVRAQLAAAEPKHVPHVIFSRIDHRRSTYPGCECQACTPTMFRAALADPEFAKELFDASKGGNVPSITEDHRYELLNAFQRPAAGASQQATGRRNDEQFGRDDNYPWRVIVRACAGARWITLEIFEWSNEEGAHRVGLDTIEGYRAGFDEVHYYVGEVA